MSERTNIVDDAKQLLEAAGFEGCEVTRSADRNLRIHYWSPEINQEIGAEISHDVLPYEVDIPSHYHLALAAQMMGNRKLNQEYGEYKQKLFNLIQRVARELAHHLDSKKNAWLVLWRLPGGAYQFEEVALYGTDLLIAPKHREFIKDWRLKHVGEFSKALFMAKKAFLDFDAALADERRQIVKWGYDPGFTGHAGRQHELIEHVGNALRDADVLLGGMK